MWANLTKDLSSFVSEASSTLTNLDTQLSSAVSGDEVDTSFPRPPPSLPTPSSSSTPLVVDGEILDITSPPVLTESARAASVRSTLMRYDSTFTEPLSPEYDLVTQEELDVYIEEFDANGRTKDIEVLLTDGGDGGVKDAFEEFVPELVPYKEFWTRYFFRLEDCGGASLERNEMIVHRLQQEYDDSLVEGIGNLLSGVGSKLQKVKQTVAKKVNEVAADFDATLSASDDSGVEEALTAKNDEIKRLKSEFAVAIKAKEMEVDDMTKRIVDLQMEVERKEKTSLAAPTPQNDKTTEASDDKPVEDSVIAKAVDNATQELKQRLEVRLENEVKKEAETWEEKIRVLERQLSERGEEGKKIEGENGKMKAEIESLKDELGKMRGEKDGAKEELEKTKGEIEKLKGELENAKEEIEKANSEKGSEGGKDDEEVLRLKEEIKVWQGRAQKCRDDRTLVVNSSKKSEALLNSTISSLQQQVEALESRAREAEEKAEKGEKDSVKSNTSSGVLVGGGVREEGEEDGWGGWGDDDE
ncbi:hypothetical protein TrCOL_g3423 [Triparma columacea]|uniref:BSD domain-containing protein n=1 Tax=Triparma columacea TaxID=722753 RepID=A0A9W7GHI6_9STRA|nr:hypothetical protein TrCOL_g3423 [Triparma columacea]